MLQCKRKGILHLNLKKLANRFDDLKIPLDLQKEMLLLILLCKCVLKQRDVYQDVVKLEIIPFWGHYVLKLSVKIAYLKIS